AAGLRLAATFDRKILVERAVDARELEVSVLGNDEPEASVVGEVVPAHEVYDYEAKYLDEGSRLLIPAPIDASVAETVRATAIERCNDKQRSQTAIDSRLLDPGAGE